ncbi:MAG: phosphoenolpyruvate--protein phosphotransferase [Clostridia bacterium]|nr:phosphoenolpyruvate--protein phosphotransferase [Clostridia bacterium]
MKHETKNDRVLQGVGVGNRRVSGTLRFFHRNEPSHKRSSVSLGKTDEWARLQDALNQVKHRLAALYERARRQVGEDEAQIFEIHGMLLEDEDFLEALREEIDAGASAEDALRRATQRISAMLEGLDNEYLSGRASDIRDLERQLQQVLFGASETDTTQEKSPFILVADDLSPSETVMLEKSQILGFVIFRGSSNSHTAILARAMGIPALVSVGVIEERFDGTFALLDAEEGTLTLSPTEEQTSLFSEKQKKDDRIAEEHDRYLRSLMNKPAVTKSGHRMLIYANVGSGEEVEAVLEAGADGIGLLRSEFLYLSADDYPGEELLFRAYSDVAVQMQGKRTVIRTLDIGADKKISYFGLPEEENPALGFRAIRLCLARRDLFKTQLRAILRASALGRLAIMLPMIVSVDEVKQSKRLIEECMEELKRENKRFDPKPELGIMIETPAAVMMCEELACEVDFFSVGTNDLTQYTLAADRQNPALTTLCEENTEPILRMIEMASTAIHRHGGWIGICGEMAADLHLTQRFADLRIDELSVSAPYLLGLRGRVTECR